jgi:hypothetical protein
MSSPEPTSLEERNKTLRTFIEEIFNKHNLSSIEKYFSKESVKVSPRLLSQYFKTFFRIRLMNI